MKPSILRQMHTVWASHPVTFDKTMLWAACCLGFFGFMRAGEFTEVSPGKNSEPRLAASDISVDSHENPQVLTVHLRQSKTDPFGVIRLGRTSDRVLCPVSALLAYMAIRPPLFHFQDGTPLSRQLLVRHVREALARVGVDTTLIQDRCSHGRGSSWIQRFLHSNTWKMEISGFHNIH